MARDALGLPDVPYTTSVTIDVNSEDVVRLLDVLNAAGFTVEIKAEWGGVLTEKGRQEVIDRTVTETSGTACGHYWEGSGPTDHTHRCLLERGHDTDHRCFRCDPRGQL